MKFNYLSKLIREFSFEESMKLEKELESKYRNRRIIFTESSFENKDFTQRLKTHHKPTGTWYSLGQEWIRWISEQGLDWYQQYNNVYMLNIDYSNILRINTVDKLKLFEKTYKADVVQWMGTVKILNIDWKKVSENYKGIEIIPYRWEMRSSIWYNSWDIASGCIWDSTAIKSYTEIYTNKEQNIL